MLGTKHALTHSNRTLVERKSLLISALSLTDARQEMQCSCRSGIVRIEGALEDGECMSARLLSLVIFLTEIIVMGQVAKCDGNIDALFSYGLLVDGKGTQMERFGLIMYWQMTAGTAAIRTMTMCLSSASICGRTTMECAS